VVTCIAAEAKLVANISYVSRQSPLGSICTTTQSAAAEAPLNNRSLAVPSDPPWIDISMSGTFSLKSGWHPKGKDGGKESWRGDFKGINQVVSDAPSTASVCRIS
jgi:hypothetical protein